MLDREAGKDGPRDAPVLPEPVASLLSVVAACEVSRVTALCSPELVDAAAAGQLIKVAALDLVVAVWASKDEVWTVGEVELDARGLPTRGVSSLLSDWSEKITRRCVFGCLRVCVADGRC